MPIVSYKEGEVSPLATCFSISRYLPHLVVTAAHVIDQFIADNEPQLRDGTCHIAALFESGDKLQESDVDAGGPVPVFEFFQRDGTDLALLTLGEVTDGQERVVPDSIGPFSFTPPKAGQYCYGWGYPSMRAVTGVASDTDRTVVEFSRQFAYTIGHITEVHPQGSKVPGPLLQSDFPLLSGMSGGPVLADDEGICGVMSSSYEPFEEGEPWASFVSLLAPLLDFEISLLDVEHSVERKVFVRELVELGYIEVEGELPSPPFNISETRSVRCGYPRMDAP